MRVTFVVAVANNGVIGRDGNLPWRLPADLAHFKRVTWGKPLVMGRRTFESIGRALPGRRNVVVSRDSTFHPVGVDVVPSPACALELLADHEEVMVVGGAAIYRALLPQADRVLLTRVRADPTGDVHFPALDPVDWMETDHVERPADAANPHALVFSTFLRRR